MKKFDKLVVVSFMGPYLLSFFVAEFVLMMQFLWKYIDDILGKGFSLLELIELIIYFMVTQIPMALPISILISSVMVFGNMSEKYELSSMKSAGVSLVRIMRPGIMIAIATAALSLLASNYLKPQANFRFQKRFRAIYAQKPNLVIEEKIFNKDFTGYAIRVNEKEKNGTGIKDILIYDHNALDKTLLNFIKADHGNMYNSSGGFVMQLNDGTQYSELKQKRIKKGKGKKYPFMRTEFKSWQKTFDLGEFASKEDQVQISRSKEDMLNAFQLVDAIDSMRLKQDRLVEQTFSKRRNQSQKGEGENIENAAQKSGILSNISKNRPPQKSLELLEIDQDTTVVSMAQYLGDKDKNRFVKRAIQSASLMKDQIRASGAKLHSYRVKRDKYLLRLHQQFAFAMICIVFIFVGAPLGSIIRKGGYGYPLLIAILFYMIFIIMTIMGEKLVRSSAMDPVLAAWFSTLLILPMGLIFTYMALRDAKLTK